MRLAGRDGRSGRSSRDVTRYGRFPGFGKGGGVSSLAEWSFPESSLDLWFSEGSAAVDRNPANLTNLLTTTRASDAYADNTSGNWSAFSSNIPRITDKGLLSEEARTNSIRNNSMQGASVPSTHPTNWSVSGANGLTFTIVSITTTNGVDVIRYRVTGTPTSAGVTTALVFELPTQIAVNNGENWTHSLLFAIVGGGLTNISQLNMVARLRDGGGSSLGSGDLLSLLAATSTLARYSEPQILANASVAYLQPALNLVNTDNTTPIDITFDIGWPQLELGAFATSPIRTTSAAATRAADVIDVTSPVPAAPFTLFAEFMIPYQPTGQFPGIFGVNDGSNTNVGGLYYGGTNLTVGMGYVSSGVEQITGGTSNTITIGAISKAAAVLATNDEIAVLNGTLGSADASVTTSAVTKFQIGRYRVGSNFMQGYLRRVAYFPTRLSNAQLQAITT